MRGQARKYGDFPASFSREAGNNLVPHTRQVNSRGWRVVPATSSASQTFPSPPRAKSMGNYTINDVVGQLSATL